MATSSGTTNLKKPWAWLAALAALCLVLASSTALYVLNPSVKLTLPWWTAIAAPAAIYALILPLCVPGLRIGGWLAGFGILSVLHVALGATTAWLYSAVTFLPIRQFVASAFWSFPPALVLDMVGSLVMTLPFLDTLAPRWRRDQDHASHLLLYEDTGELVTGDHADIVMLDIATGRELARADSGSGLQSVLFPTPGFDRDFYLCSMLTVTRARVAA